MLRYFLHALCLGTVYVCVCVCVSQSRTFEWNVGGTYNVLFVLFKLAACVHMYTEPGCVNENTCFRDF